VNRLYRPEARGPESLTERETDVLRLYIELGGYKHIAAHMHLSVSTVKQHATAALRKLGVQTIGQAVVLYDRWEKEHP
jgi:DNA-binding NarL/FixJ family response regulator